MSRDAATVVAIAGGGAGLVLGWFAGPFGLAVVLLGVVVLAIGYAYDLFFKGTAWSWLPFAVGIPLLPVYGWVGATGGVPASFVVLVPAAVVAGAALAVANARADEARDRASGTVVGGDPARQPLVVAGRRGAVIGRRRGRRSRRCSPPAPERSRWQARSSAAVIVAAGLVIGRSDDAGRRERAWELQAVGVAVLAAAWLAGVPLAG